MIFQYKNRVGYNVSLGRIGRVPMILVELHHVNTSCKFRARCLEQLAECLEQLNVNDCYRRFNVPFDVSILFKTLQFFIVSVTHPL
jgi:hypothetical protein